MDDEFRNHVLEQLKVIEKRLALLENRVENAAEAYSRARFLVRRIPIRPPMWKFEQYSPRPILMPPVNYDTHISDLKLKIAIVTPSRNSSAYLRDTIESVLAQDYPHVYYVVQDGASQDETITLLEEYGERIAWRSEPDNGQAQAINRGLTGVDCDIMGYLNADDMLLPGTLTYVSHFFHTHPDIDFVYGHRIFTNYEGLEIGRAVLPAHDAKTLIYADYIPQETMFWRRRVRDAIGPFDENFHYALDWDFILRAQVAGFNFFRLSRFLACFRVHDAQKTARLYDIGRREMQILRQRSLGYAPRQSEIQLRVMPYLLRQLLCHCLYKLGLLRL